jgi:hypothetical protein
MTNAVISAVEAMAENKGQPFIKGGGVPLFEWHSNAPVEDIFEEDVTLADKHEVLLKMFLSSRATMLTPSLPTMLRMDSTQSAMMHPTTILLKLTMKTWQMLTKPKTPLSLSLMGLSLAPMTKTERIWRRK